MIVPQFFLSFMTLTLLKNTCKLFYRVFLNLGCLMFSYSYTEFILLGYYGGKVLVSLYYARRHMMSEYLHACDVTFHF